MIIFDEFKVGSHKLGENKKYKDLFMSQKLVITLDEATTIKYLELAQKRTKAELNADCEPSGSSLRIDISPDPYDSYVSCENDEIGVAAVQLINV